jgi:hypothetical protein
LSRCVLPLALGSALSGCSTTYKWVKEGFGPQHAQAQFAACQLEAERYRWSADEDQEERAARVLHEAQLCMKADGWRRVSEDGEAASDETGGTGGGQSRARVSTQTGERPSEAAAGSTGPQEAASSHKSSDEDSSGKSRDKSSKDASDNAEDEDDDEDE